MISSKYNTLASAGINFGVVVSYFVIYWALYGSTPGKMLMAQRIVKEDGSEIGLGNAALRYLGFILSGFSIGIGHLMILFDDRKQALQDRVAGTVVIREHAKPKTWIAAAMSIIYLLVIIGLNALMIYKSFSLAFAANVPPYPG